MKVTAEDARRFLVARHFLAPARSLEGGPDAVLEVFRKLGSIQFDPIAVAGRNHDLVLHARVADYEPAWCDALYERREIFEATNKALSFVPTSEFPWFRLGWAARGRGSTPRLLAENAAVAERVLERIRAEGPLSSRDFEREHGADEGLVRDAGERRARRARGVHRHGRDRPRAARRQPSATTTCSSGCFPPSCSRSEVPEREQLLHKLLSRYRAHGLLGAGGAGGTFARIAEPATSATAAHRSSSSAARSCPSTSRACAASASSSPRSSRCCRRRRSRRPPSRSSRRSTRCCGTPPLLASLFDFEYVWEGFFPPAKRRWGYYVLPILFGDRFVGRIEPRIDRERGPRRGARRLVGGRLRAAPRRRVRRRDARRAPRLPALRRRRPHRVGARAHRGEAALSQPTVKLGNAYTRWRCVSLKPVRYFNP